MELGMDCAVIAPGSISKRSGDRIKTDQRDARKLAEYFTCGLLTIVSFPIGNLNRRGVWCAVARD